MSAWDPELAAEKAQKAYRYVAGVYPKGTGYESLDAHTEAAYQAERAGDWNAYLEALRGLCRAARAEAMREREGAA